MGNLTATPIRRTARRPLVPYRSFLALVSAGFRRFATYRQATVAGAFTNVVFGFVRCYMFLAVAAAAGGTAGGYRASQLTTYVWVTQGLLATVSIWGDGTLADRIRTGDIVSDLLRPVPPVLSYLATDVGRACYAAMTRFVTPVAVGALAFDMYEPRHLATYPMFVLSVALGTLVCFGCRYVVNGTAYWLLDARGPQMVWNLTSAVLGGLYFPLAFLPGWASAALWLGTPFPSILQAPVEVLVESHRPGGQAGMLALQAAWAAVMLIAAVVVQRAGERRLVVQGG